MFEYAPPPAFLEDKVIVITGAGDGIGKTCAKTFAQHGATVVLLGRSVKKLEAVYDEIEFQAPGKAFIHPLDLATASAENYDSLSQSIQESFGHVDVLLHNAALLGARSPIEFYPATDWLELMQVNVNAAFILTKTLLPLLKKGEDGRLLFTSSSVGRTGRAHWGAYGVSKFAIEGLMQTLALELKQTSNVTVCSINPGGTRTSMRRDAFPAENPATQPSPEDIMPVYLYLLSTAGKNYHGAALDVQGFSVKP